MFTRLLCRLDTVGSRLALDGKYFSKEFGMLHILNIVFIHDVTKILIYEIDKWNKLKAKFIGLYHFIINRYGKYNLK